MSEPGHDPSALGRVDRVDVVEIDSSVRVGRVRNFIRSDAVVSSISLQGSDAEGIAQLWRGLVPGGAMMCHIPPYGLRFW